MEDGNNSIFSSPCVFSKFPRLLHPEDMESQQVMLWLLGAGIAHRHLLLLQPEYFSWFLQACRSPTGARELQCCQRKHIWPLKTWSNHIFENLFPLMSVMMWHTYSKAKLLIPSIGVWTDCWTRWSGTTLHAVLWLTDSGFPTRINSWLFLILPSSKCKTDKLSVLF